MLPGNDAVSKMPEPKNRPRITEFLFQRRAAGSDFKIIENFERNNSMFHNTHAGMHAKHSYAEALLKG
jgi:hypothetical protein